MKNLFRNAAADIPASVVVFLVALPLCVGIALGSNAPNLFSGLIAGIIGGIVVGFLSNSSLSVSGPAAGLTAIVASAIATLPAYEAFLLAVVIAGLFQVLFGFLKVGYLGDYLPNSVIKGVVAAIGLILVLKQIPHLLGYDKDFEGDETFSQNNNGNTFTDLVFAFYYLSPLATIIGVIGIAIQVVWDKLLVHKNLFFRIIPAPLVVVAAGILIPRLFEESAYFTLGPEHMVNIPIAGSLAEFTSFFISPDWSFITNRNVWATALTIALVASSETLISIEAADKMDPYKRATDNNRELKAQGIGNIVSGFLGGLPLTSVIVRSAANINAGAKSKLSSILQGLLILLCVLLIPGLLNKMPFTALASILIYLGYKLAKPVLFREMYQKGWEQFIPFAVTVLGILFTDLLQGIIMGAIVGLYFVLKSNYNSAVFVINDGKNYLFRLRKDITYLSKPIVKRKLETVPAGSSVLIDLTRAEFIDQDIIDTINEFSEHAPLKNIMVQIKKSTYNPMHELIQTTEEVYDDRAH